MIYLLGPWLSVQSGLEGETTFLWQECVEGSYACKLGFINIRKKRKQRRSLSSQRETSLLQRRDIVHGDIVQGLITEDY